MAKKTIVAEAEQMIKPTEPANVPAEPAIENPEAKKPKTVKKEKQVKKPEAVSETTPKKPARKPAKPKAKRAAKPGPKKVLEAKAEKPTGRKPGPAKKMTPAPPEKAEVVKAQKAPGRKPGRKPAAKKSGLIGRKTNLLKMGESAFLYSLELTQRVEDLEREIANYERMFEAIRTLFSREMHEIEEWMEVVWK